MASIELKSISGKGIKSLALFQKPSLYTVVSLTNVNQPTAKKSKKKTTVDRSNGENPVWDQPIRIDIDISHNQDLILQFDLKAEAILGSRVVGRAFIPVADLDFSGAVQRVSYQVKTPEGKSNGVLSFFYRVDGPGVAVSPPKQSASSRSVDYHPHPPPSSVPLTGFNPEISFEPSAQPMTSYPPLPTPDPVIPSSQRAAGSGYYPTLDPAVTYPTPGTAAFDIYPLSETTSSYPPPLSAAEYYPRMEPGPSNVGGYYRPPVYPPQPASESYCRSIPQPPLASYYPSAQQPAPACYYPSPASSQQPAPACFYPSSALDVYGYQQQGWDRGLYGYN